MKLAEPIAEKIKGVSINGRNYEKGFKGVEHITDGGNWLWIIKHGKITETLNKMYVESIVYE